MQRYFIEVMYDGRAFHGSQVQGQTPTVQLAINNALSTLLRTSIESFGASRTDEGVHALCNYYHFDFEAALHPHFHYKLNAILPHEIAVNKIFLAIGADANARFDALSRSYRYKVYSTKNPFDKGLAYYFPLPLDMEILQETAALIKEYKDFESFSKRNTQAYTFLCHIHDSYWEQKDGQLHYIVKANRFLRGMVRGLVGTQLQIARGRGSVADFRKILEAKDCTLADFSVPGNGLYLEKIEYPEGLLQALQLR